MRLFECNKVNRYHFTVSMLNIHWIFLYLINFT
uniref:Uncharacterized protein n=1 Tax=Tetranychus urticae TaxID=32264 RepID=T1KE72_TETUR